ncbi:MAG: hypothetical protein PWQ54_2051 [Bacteroidales bacterium]|nr:hypothetical protein [Bacteroidales bacterium]
MNFFKIIFLLFLFFSTGLIAQNADWQTHYEQSGKLATPRYAETVSFLERLDAKSDKLFMDNFGFSPQQRPIKYIIYDRDGLTDPTEIKASGRVLLMVQAGIHPGESEGKDAMLLLLRDQVIENKYEALFEHVSLLFIPIFNVDGHERFSQYGRINQNGPAEMGWRVTAQNYNLNRDYLKADAPEMQAWLKLFHRFDPDFFIDTHTTDGADYQYVMTYGLELGGNMDAGLTAWQKDVFLPYWEKAMHADGFPVFPYVSFRKWHDPRSGLVSWMSGPMLSQAYTAHRNRTGLLLETHMLKPYNQRVDATLAAVLHCMEMLALQGKQLLQLNQKADEYSASSDFRAKEFVLQYKLDQNDSIMVPFAGVHYQKLTSELTGGDLFVYDASKPDTFLLPLFQTFVPHKFIKLPEAYLVPVEWTAIIDRLKWHGIQFEVLKQSAEFEVEQYVFTDISWHQRPYEGRHQVSDFSITKRIQKVTYPAGSLKVPTDQPLIRLIAHMLEPEGDGSLLKWGFFDGIFEQKEYAETYVMEPLARRMLDSIPGLRKTYETKKLAEPDFAQNSWAQLNWFYRQTPWWDEKYMVYPVGRVLH